ncbi:MAG: hypothetical protein CVU50_04105 [Candidatus Cloacimonetes bacterium HGW-Cloacimonetes-3]|jgi:hypothetical protein|nr:MAG: hypothetical protein CVU50_04105 [Candidatus Cloacimonetes bacterium HGW-Cloacimonetes-3]
MILLQNGYLWQNGAFTKTKNTMRIDNDKIEQIYSDPTPIRASAKGSIDLEGAYVYPGFTDTHTHSFEGGLYALGVDLSRICSIEELKERLSNAYLATTDADPIFAWQFEETAIVEKRFPLLAELDAVCPDKPLILRRIDGHSCMLNSFGRKLISHIVSTEAEVLRGKNNDLAVHYFHGKLSEEAVIGAYHEAARIALKGGFTGVHTMIGDADQSIAHYRLIRDNLGAFPIKYSIYPQSFNISAALDAGAVRIGGCILADGSIGSATAAMKQPYQNSVARGILYQSDEFWMEFIAEAHKHNLQVGVHCIGDRAITQINNVYKHLADTDYRDLRHQLIHCELTDDALIAEIKASGAVPVMQPNFDLLWGGESSLYDRMLGQNRSKNMNRFGSFTQNSVRITGSSDWYITPLDIVQSIHAAMHHHNPNERLTHSQAVDIYTTNAAWLIGEDSVSGAIEPGYSADFTVLSHPLDDGHNTPKVLKVICNGAIVYEAT